MIRFSTSFPSEKVPLSEISHVAETLSIADYVYVIANGKIIGQGTPDSINQDKSAQLRQFIDGLPDGPVPFHYPAAVLSQDLIEGVIT